MVRDSRIGSQGDESGLCKEWTFCLRSVDQGDRGSVRGDLYKEWTSCLRSVDQGDRGSVRGEMDPELDFPE